MSARIFAAIDLPEAVRAELAGAITKLRASLRECGLDDAFRWVAPANLHVTLRFLGDIPDDDVPRVIAALECGLSAPAGRLTLEGLDTFPAKGRPRVLHSPVAAGAALLQTLRDRTDAALAPVCAWEPETRPFAPHLTLARGRDRGELDPAALRDVLDAAHWPRLDVDVTHVTLFRSVTHPSGPQYSALARAALRSA